jgi:hypothetical protein
VTQRSSLLPSAARPLQTFAKRSMLAAATLASLASCSNHGGTHHWTAPRGYVEVDRIAVDQSVDVLWIDPLSHKRCWLVESRSASGQHLGSVASCQEGARAAVSKVLGSLIGSTPDRAIRTIIVANEGGGTIARVAAHSGLFLAPHPASLTADALLIKEVGADGVERPAVRVRIQ